MAQAAPVAQPDVELTYEIPEQVTLLSDAWRRIRRNRLALVGGGVIIVLLIVALISMVWTPYPTWLQAVGPTYQPPSPAHPLGLDNAGRDILSRIMGGALITVQVGIGSAIIVSLIGIPLGLLAGFYRGKVDTAISFVINIWYGIPDLFEAFLSFLGLGLPPPTPSWGAMASDGYHGMDFAPHIVLAPTIALSITLMAFNWLGDGLRDAFDPRMRR